MTAAPVPTPVAEAAPGTAAVGGDANADIDLSCRWPVTLLSCAGAVWYVFALLLLILGGIKLHAPGMLASYEWLTVGRVRPAAMNLLVYGFASQAALGVLLWLLARLGRQRLWLGAAALVGGVFWNIALLLGTVAILAQGPNGFEWLEMPRYAWMMLLTGYMLIGLCAVVNFWQRRQQSLYVSQWYLLGALFWFPWILTAAFMLLHSGAARGTMQSVVNTWYVGNCEGLWLGSVALAAIFYFIPKLSGRPLWSAPLAAFGFWTFAVFTAWSGLVPLVGGPVPRWMPALSTVATMLLGVPLIAVALNWYWTLDGDCSLARRDHVFRFIIAGAACYLVTGVVSIPLAFPQVAQITHLTFLPLARSHLVLFGFLSFVFSGCLYFILPRVLGLEWPRPGWIRLHSWCAGIGLLIVVLSLTVGGLVQGVKMNNPGVTPLALARSLTPWIGLSSLGLLWLLAGQVLFLMHLSYLLRGFCAVCCPACCRREAVAAIVNAGGAP